MTKDEKREMERIQENVRQKVNPGWRQQLEMHRGVISELGPREGENLFNAFVRWKYEQRMKKP